ncbi:winged helix-turn-helix transcriptional regulator [Clostridium sp. P21]|uniref:Winged helix-turn-helix transcriptional regulator n=1 Tax=Clostridium muellerianum TaxID=2716538 RepID=A0A7Y0HP39_9CLOT|nr:metalloregulator ArsR/SmtB family transcription factor [Clostridium muellerianum]NMM62656.1 winged helix-turn-helix transcriptional regulator [Clostridium muellerianum]
MDTKELAKIFKALSNENRLELYFQILRSAEKSFDTNCECFINDVISKLNIGAPTISHHLKELSNANLIFTEKKGKFLVARANEELLNEICSILTIKRDEKK